MRTAKIILINSLCRCTKKMNNEETIWNWLYIKFRNVYGVAALMGNLFAESSLNPLCANGIKKHGLTNEEYTAIAEHTVLLNGVIMPERKTFLNSQKVEINQ